MESQKPKFVILLKLIPTFMVVISLPVGAFKPFGGSNARTCVLYLRKAARDNKKRFLAQAERVGYDITSKYYRETDLNDLPVIAEAYHGVKLNLQ